LNTLIPLLKSNDNSILKPVIWISSELAVQACSLLKYIVPLLNSDDLYIRYYVLECIAICAKGSQVNEFLHLIIAISDIDLMIRQRAMELLSNTERSQLEAVVKLTVTHQIDNYKLHEQGLNALLNLDQVDEETIINMLSSNHQVTQQYGIILVSKNPKRYSKALRFCMSSGNTDIKEFAQMVSCANIE
jgi:hypothetical protein